MTSVTAHALLAHLLGERWHIEDLLLYGGASLGLILGIGLFLWGRVERVRNTSHPDASTSADGERESFLRTPDVRR